MGKQSEKKRLEELRSKSELFYRIILVVNALYIFLYMIPSYEDLSFWDIFYLLFFIIIDAITYKGMTQAIEVGVNYESYFDLFCINNAV